MANIPVTFPDSQAATITRLLREAAAPGFFGEIVLVFQNGQFVLIRVLRTEKPEAQTAGGAK